METAPWYQMTPIRTFPILVTVINVPMKTAP